MSAAPDSKQICLATVLTPEFLPGAMAMIRAAYRGERRDRADYALLKDQEAPALERTFCGGFMALSQDLLRRENFLKYLEVMDRFSQDRFTSGHTDQAIFNVLFADRAEILDASYNYNLRHMRAITDVSASQARILHYGGWEKPWDPAGALAAAQRNPALAPLMDRWRLAYRACLNDLARDAA